MDNEEIKYSYTGDTSGLQQSTEDAISQLERFGKAMDRTSADTAAAFRNSGVDGFVQSMSGLLVPVQAVEREMKKLSDTARQVAAEAKNAVNSAASATPNVSNVQYVESAMGDVTRTSAYLGSEMATLSQRVTAAFDNMKASVQSYKDKAVESFTSVRDRLSQVADAFKRLGTDSDARAKALTKLRDAFANIKEKAGAAASKVKEFGNRAKEATSHSKLLRKALGALSAVKLAEVFSQAIKQSIEYIENLNLFKVAMGDAYEAGRKFIEQMQEVYGMDPSTLMRHAGNFFQLATAIEMPDKAAEKMSLALTKLTNDVASLFNMPIEQVFTNLSSGMQGMSRAVRKYGMDIRATTLQQTALSLGITGQVQTMSEANRQGLRFITMMRQAANAQGDFARNIETPANQLRIFREQLSQLGRAIGNFVLVPLGKIIQYVNGAIMALRMMLQFLAKVFGMKEETFQISIDSDAVEVASDTADAVGDIGTEATKTAKKLKNMLAPFDELNILQDQQDSGGGGGIGGIGGVGGSDVLDPAIAKAIEDMNLGLENIKMKANEVRDAILEFLGFKVDGGEIVSWDPAILQGISDDFLNLRDQLAEAVENTKEIFSELWEGTVYPILTSLWDTAQFVFLSILDIILTVYNQALVPVLQWLASTAGPAFARIFGGFMDTVKLVFTTIRQAVEQAADTFSVIWNTWIRPILDVVVEVVESIWNETIKPIVDNIIKLVGELWEFLMVVVRWVAQALGPYLVPIIQALIPVISTVINAIGSIINGLLLALRGIIKFLTGVFTGDWKKAWEGVSLVFKGIFTAITGVFKGAINLIIDAINTLVAFVWPVIRSIGNGIGSIAFAAGKLLGKNWGWTMPDYPPRIPHLAEGGIITGPTLALMGEAGRNEAVIPLDNSPQMEQFANKIAAKVAEASRNNSTQVSVYIGGEEFDDYIYEVQSRRDVQTNGGE